MKAILATGHDYSWFVLNQTIIEKEFALSGSEQNPDITGKDLKLTLATRLAKGAPGAGRGVQGARRGLRRRRHPARTRRRHEQDRPRLEVDHDRLEREIIARDNQVGNKFGKDLQLMAITNARQYRGDRLTRVVKPHRLLDPAHGPLIAVRLNILTRKTLGGLETNLDSQVMRPDGSAFPGLYAAGEVAGFGGGGVHGYNALEGTFLGGCIFSGRAAGRALAQGARVTRTALVTGASSGIGAAVAEALVARGDRVFGTSRDPDSVKEKIAGVTYLPLDLTDDASIEACAAAAGDVDILINNAGESQSGPLEELPMDAIERLFRTNVFGAVRLTQLVLPGMRQRGYGRVVMVGSMLASFPLAYRSSYVATKAAIKGFATAARREVSPYGVGISTVEPGSINTGIGERRTHYLADGSPHTADYRTMINALDAQRAQRDLGGNGGGDDPRSRRRRTPPFALRGGQQRAVRLRPASARPARGRREDGRPPPRTALIGSC